MYSVRDISLGRFTEKNAVEMLELFLECMPEYNIDRPDGDGKPLRLQIMVNLKSQLYTLIAQAILPCCWHTPKAMVTCVERWSVDYLCHNEQL